MSLMLRPHHGLCIHNFVGKGYSEAFTANMKTVIARLAQEDPFFTLAKGEDVLCAACPHNKTECESAAKVRKFDSEVLRLCGLQPGDTLKWSEFAALVDSRILAAGEFSTVCASCEWYQTCQAIVNQE